jgi:hypothetical protein
MQTGMRRGGYVCRRDRDYVYIHMRWPDLEVSDALRGAMGAILGSKLP